jgi:putative oxidoreductase
LKVDFENERGFCMCSDRLKEEDLGPVISNFFSIPPYIYSADFPAIPSLLLLTIRLFWGAWYTRSGWLKLDHIDHVSKIFIEWHIPFATFCVYIVGITHFIGGLCLIMGYFSRLVSVPLAFTMIIAYLTVHREAMESVFHDPQTFLQQPPFLFLFTNIVILLFGPGNFSIDHIRMKTRGIV